MEDCQGMFRLFRKEKKTNVEAVRQKKPRAFSEKNSTR